MNNNNKIGKKLINNVSDCVDESLKGFSFVYPSLKLHSEYRFISLFENKVTNSVALLSGGGSGHEPFSAGYVGRGMLSGSLSGSVFASPPKSNILHAIRYLHKFYKGGIVVIIPNYTGDCLNFGMAIEHAKSEGIPVLSMSFGEDCASGSDSIAGKRGMCGIILAYKICGGLAEKGKDSNYILASLKNIQNNMATLGVSVQPCSLPGQPTLFTIDDDQLELGVGVHGEAGIATIKLASAKEVVKIILEKMYASLNLENECSVAVLINNLGASSQLEQNIICYEVYRQLSEKKYRVERLYSGLCFTSLEMAGFQICILKLPTCFKNEWLQHLDAETDCPSWTGCLRSIPLSHISEELAETQDKPVEKKTSIYQLSTEQQSLLKNCLHNASYQLIKHESKLNDLDSGCGDGDCGTTLKNLAQGVLDLLNVMDYSRPERVLESLSEIAESKMGGTSGAIYSICFTAIAKHFTESQFDSLCIAWVRALKNAIETVMNYSRAQLGDRTIIDAIKPASEAMDEYCKNQSYDINEMITNGLREAIKGCDKTKNMKARAGRASYVSSNYLINEDAGAFGFVIIFEAIVNCIKNQTAAES